MSKLFLLQFLFKRYKEVHAQQRAFNTPFIEIKGDKKLINT